MELKNLNIIILAVLVITVTGIVLFELQGLAAEGKSTSSGVSAAGNGNDGSNIFTITAAVPVAMQRSGDLLISQDRGAPDSSSRTITDMAGRTVTIPGNISMVLCTSPPPTSFVYMLAPDKLGGWQSSPSNESRQFIPQKYWNLTVLSWSPVNYEAYIAMHPDLVFIGCESGNSDLSSANLTQEKFGTIPVVCVDNARNTTEYGPTLIFMGDILGVPDVAAKENGYYQAVLDEVRTKVTTIPEEKRVRVYYAEGTNGLSTDLIGSPHSQLIDVCGGLNVAGSSTTGSVSSTVTRESVLMWKPDVIITTSKEFFTQVYTEPTWQQVPAVQNRRVYLTPGQPNNWFDRPPGVNRIVGIPWTAHILYPDLFPEDWFREKAKEFYSVYYHYELSDGELTSLLNE
jgi:iron complex transport system substrate-binding protein